MKRTPKKEKFDIFNPRPLPTSAEILRMYDYDREKGVLLRRASTSDVYGKLYVDNYRVGEPVEPGLSGYVRCRVECFDGRKIVFKSRVFAVHRLIWKLETGEDPVGVIDHINGIRHDNRFSNLRDVTIAENALNIHIGLWRSMEERRKAKIEQEKHERAAAKEARRYARFLKLKAEYEPELHKKANAATRTST